MGARSRRYNCTPGGITFDQTRQHGNSDRADRQHPQTIASAPEGCGRRDHGSERGSALRSRRQGDTGRGIPADKLEEVFQPFVQIHSPGPGVSKGTGLGLPISRELARAMGGDLSAASESGNGSTFTLCLPRVK